MKILIDILHPAHVHFFRNAITLWKEKHEVLVTSRDKEMTLRLLDLYDIRHKCISTQGEGTLSLISELLKRDINLFHEARRFKPDILTGIAGVSIAHVGKLISKPSIVFYDTEIASLSNALTYPFAAEVCTPECYKGDIGKKHLKYKGYHELAYLHPSRFTPDRSVLQEAGISSDRIFFLRFVSWKASHDIGEKGISEYEKKFLIDILKEKGRVLISSEGKLPPELEQYRIDISPEKVHHVLAFSSLVIGDSATMASEAAMLGVPAVYIDDRGRGYTDELEKRYGLVYNFKCSQEKQVNAKVREIADNRDHSDEWTRKRKKMLDESIDVTAFMVEHIEGFNKKPQ